MKHILSVLVENKPGVLSRVTGMVSRRGFNIDSLSVGPTEDPTMSRITIIVKADELAYEQLTKQLNKLISVFKITDLTDVAAIERELVLFKVNAAPDRRNEIIEIANVFRAKIVDVGRSSLTIEATGDESKLKGMEDLLPRLRHQGNHAHGQNRHVARLEGRLRGQAVNDSRQALWQRRLRMWGTP
ncbi:MAG: acetolactate synthase small subunit [Senegalimassilia faecalis]